MKTKTYFVYPKGQFDMRYEVEAPNKRIAKWCGLNLFDNDYLHAFTIKELVVERKRNK